MLALNVSYVHTTLPCLFTFHEMLLISTLQVLVFAARIHKHGQIQGGNEILVPLLFIFK